MVCRPGLRRPHRSLCRTSPLKKETLAAINEARRAGRAIVRATNLVTGDDRLIDPAADASPLGEAAAGAARADQSGPAEIEGQNWFLAVFNPPLDLAIIGAVHVAQPLAAMASLTGFGVRIIDPRTAFATEARFPGIRLSHQWADEAFEKEPLGRAQRGRGPHPRPQAGRSGIDRRPQIELLLYRRARFQKNACAAVSCG